MNYVKILCIIMLLGIIILNNPIIGKQIKDKEIGGKNKDIAVIDKDTRDNDLENIAIAAYRDSKILQSKVGSKVIYYRYLWWTEDWPHALLLTKAQQNILSLQGFLANPVLITHDPISKVRLPGYLIRINTTESGWQNKFITTSFKQGKLDVGNPLLIYEKFANIDFVFHQREEVTSKKDYIKYYPPGYYKDSKDPKNIHYNYYECTNTLKTAKGTEDNPTIIRQAAMWANPLTNRIINPKYDRMKESRLGSKEQILALDGLRETLCTEVPLLLGQWWLIQTQRNISIRNIQENVGYNAWFGMLTRRDYFDILGVDERKAEQIFRELREIVPKSKISQQNRIVFTLGSTSGLVLGTLDTFTEKGRGIARRNLLKGEFDAVVEEYIGHLPNDLPITVLVSTKDVFAQGKGDDEGKKILITKAGDLQDSAPDKIGPDDSALNLTRDHRVHANISCYRCHGVDVDYIKPISTWARNTFTKDRAWLQGKTEREIEELKANYLRNIEEKLTQDRVIYAKAFSNLTINIPNNENPDKLGLTVAGFSRIYAGAWNQYVATPITTTTSSLELGFSGIPTSKPSSIIDRDKDGNITSTRLINGLIKFNRDRSQSDLVLGEFIPTKNPEIKDPKLAIKGSRTITRLEWEESYQLTQFIARGIRIPEVLKIKGKD